MISLADSLKLGTSEKATTFLIDCSLVLDTTKLCQKKRNLFQIFVALSKLFIYFHTDVSIYEKPKNRSQFQASFYDFLVVLANENNSTGIIIVVKSNFFVYFLGELRRP